MSSKSVQFYFGRFCPFAQRSWITLREKGVDFELVEIDPYNKTPEFLAMNPRGLIPTLVHNGHSVYESLIVNEYIDEAWPEGTKLMPSDPYQRAHGRIWMDFIGKKIVPYFYQYLMRQDEEEQKQARDSFLDGLKEFAGAMSSEGPFFFGKDFSLVDIALIPFYILIFVLEHYRGFSLPEDGSLDRLKGWKQAWESRPTVTGTLTDRKQLLDRYKRYSDNAATSEVAKAINKGAPLP